MTLTRSVGGWPATSARGWGGGGFGRDAGASPRLSPLDAEQAQADLAAVVHQAPAAFGLASSYQTRWWLAGLRRVVPWLAQRCLATVCRTLRRYGLRYRRGRRHVHSPDPEYAAKVARLQTITWYTRQDPPRNVRLYQDELTYYRRPTVAHDYAVVAVCKQPLARQGLHGNTARRIAGCLDAATGQLQSWQRAHFDHQTLQRFYAADEAAYPHAAQLFLIQDNWPVHQQAELLAALRGSKFTLVPLPTYAPWLNPIEKVWRKLYAEVLHLHPWAQDWPTLQARVQTWLDRWAEPSRDLLRYCGLLCPS